MLNKNYENAIMAKTMPTDVGTTAWGVRGGNERREVSGVVQIKIHNCMAQSVVEVYRLQTFAGLSNKPKMKSLSIHKSDAKILQIAFTYAATTPQGTHTQYAHTHTWSTHTHTYVDS